MKRIHRRAWAAGWGELQLPWGMHARVLPAHTHLEPSRVSEHPARPVDEAVKAAHLGNQLAAWGEQTQGGLGAVNAGMQTSTLPRTASSSQPTPCWLARSPSNPPAAHPPPTLLLCLPGRFSR